MLKRQKVLAHVKPDKPLIVRRMLSIGIVSGAAAATEHRRFALEKSHLEEGCETRRILAVLGHEFGGQKSPKTDL